MFGTSRSVGDVSIFTKIFLNIAQTIKLNNDAHVKRYFQVILSFRIDHSFKGPVTPPERCWSVPSTVPNLDNARHRAQNRGKYRKHGRCLSGAPLKPALL